MTYESNNANIVWAKDSFTDIPNLTDNQTSVGAGRNSYGTRRASLGGFAEGSTKGWEFNSLLNAGYDFRRGNWTISPTASIAHTRVNLDNFTESGSLSPLFSVDGPHMKRDRAMIGAGVNVQLTPMLSVCGYYDGQLGSSDYRSNNVTAGLKFDF